MIMTDYHAPCVMRQKGANYYIGQEYWRGLKDELITSAIILTSIAICLLFSF
jgi:hypothetical protein